MRCLAIVIAGDNFIDMSYQYECDEKETEIQHLTTFKNGYDDMDEAFLQYAANLPTMDSTGMPFHQPRDSAAVATKKVTLTVEAFHNIILSRQSGSFLRLNSDYNLKTISISQFPSFTSFLFLDAPYQ